MLCDKIIELINSIIYSFTYHVKKLFYNKIEEKENFYIPFSLSECKGEILPKKRLSRICSSNKAVECISTRGHPVIRSVTVITDV